MSYENYRSQIAVELTPADVIEAKHQWVSDPQVHCTFATADDYIQFLRGAHAAASREPTASSSAPAAPALRIKAPVAKPRVVTRADDGLRAFERLGFSSLESYRGWCEGVRAGCIVDDVTPLMRSDFADADAWRSYIAGVDR